jgi:formyl-CoA transferase
VTVSDPELGQIPMPGVVPTFSRTPGRIVHAGPRLGEHNDEVFTGLLALPREEMARLAREGII